MKAGDTSLPFDQYQRYRLVADLINRVRPKGATLRILDVGGRTGNLRAFLPKDRVELVDLEASDLSGLVLGDGARLPFAAESFDAVVSFDTLEHVPPRSRRAFVQESWRVAKSWVIHAGPYQTLRVEAAEARLRSFLSEKLKQDHRYLTEHHEHGLPKRRSLEAQLAELGGEVLCVGHANIERWLGLMCISLYMDRDAPLRGIAAEFHRFYNEALYAHDHDGEVYRHAVVAAFGGAQLPNVEGLFSQSGAPATATKPITALARALMRFDAERDAVVPEWERLHEVNAALADDIEQHTRALAEARAEVGRRKEMGKELRLDARELRAELKAVAKGAREERREVAKALKELEQALGGNVRAREALEQVVLERDAELGLVRAELERGRSEGEAVIAVLAADLEGHRVVRQELAELLEKRDAEGGRLLKELEECATASTEVIEELEEELDRHRASSEGLEEALLKERAEIEEEREAYQEEVSSHREVIAELSVELTSVRGVALGLEQELERANEDFDAVRGDLSADLAAHRETVGELEGLLQEVYKGALDLEGEVERERAEVGAMRAEYEDQLGEHRTTLVSLEDIAREEHVEALRLQSELAREREEGSEAREALEADLAGHRELVMELQQVADETESALREQEAASEQAREEAERARKETERRVLGDIERQHEGVLESERSLAASELETAMVDLRAHRNVLDELREELARNVSVREGVEGDLRRVEEIAERIAGELRGAQEALGVSAQEKDAVTQELLDVSGELGSERDVLEELRGELSDRWGNLLRAVRLKKRKY